MDLNALFSLDGRVALVTGGSRGIGRMIAEGFLSQGATVYITARKAPACEETAAELSATYGEGRCVALPHDVSGAEGIGALVADLREREDHLDILVNNAGAAWAQPFDEFPEAGWDKVMNINTKTPFFLTQAVKDLLVAGKEKSGHLSKVINIASIDGISVNPLEAYSYAASKAGAIHLTKRMATHLAPEGIIVSAIAPGAFASEMNVDARDHGDELAGLIPAGRIGRAEDMAAAAVYLASDAGDYVVGATLVVDGAATLVR